MRGPSDWSGALAVTFYGLVIGAFVLSVVGGLTALLGKTLETGRRLFCITVGTVVPTLFAFATWVILDFLSGVS